MPKLISSWQGTLNSSRFIYCSQLHEPYFQTRSEEDCLSIRYVIPLDENKKRYAEELPILLWIHGGSFQMSGKAVFNTTGIIRSISSRKIVFAAANYRLGFFGFASLHDKDFRGNNGLHDVVEAIKFTHSNYRALGGDINRITLAGDSAGAAIVSLLSLFSYVPKYFQRSMLFSGSSLAPWAVRSDQTLKNTLEVAELLGCKLEAAFKVKSCLQMTSTARLREALEVFWSRKLDLVSTNKVLANRQSMDYNWFEAITMAFTFFTPVQDDVLLPTTPKHLMKERAKIPIFISYTSDERIIGARTLGEEVIYYKESLAETFSRAIDQDHKNRNEVIASLIEYCFGGNLSPTVADFIERFAYCTGGEQIAFAHEEALEYSLRGAPVYLYKMDVENGSDVTPHGKDVALLFDTYLFGKIAMGLTETYQEFRELRFFADKLADRVAQFVQTGKLPGAHLFNTSHRFANKLTCYGEEIVDADTHFYYLWRRTIPAIERLHNSPHVKLLTKPDCSLPYRVPFYVAVTVLVFFMGICSLLYVRLQRSIGNKKSHDWKCEIQSAMESRNTIKFGTEN